MFLIADISGERLDAFLARSVENLSRSGAQKLLEEGFSRYTVRQVIRKGDHIGTLDVAGGGDTQVTVYAAEDWHYALAEDEQVRLVLPGPGFVYAPVAEGGDAGVVYVTLQGKAVGKVPVRYGKTVERAPEESKNFFQKLMGG